MISAPRFAAGKWHIDDHLRLLPDKQKRQFHADDIEQSFKAHADEIPDGLVLEYAPYMDQYGQHYGIVIEHPVMTEQGPDVEHLDAIERFLGNQNEHPMGFQPNRPPMSAETLVTKAIARAREISDAMNAQANDLLTQLREKGIPGLEGLGSLGDLLSRGQGDKPFGGPGTDGKDGDGPDPSQG